MVSKGIVLVGSGITTGNYRQKKNESLNLLQDKTIRKYASIACVLMSYRLKILSMEDMIKREVPLRQILQIVKEEGFILYPWEKREESEESEEIEKGKKEKDA